MSTFFEAQRLAQEAQGIITAAGKPARGTTTILDAPAALTAGEVVVVVNPPTVTYPTWDEVDAEWQAWLITGPTSDPAAAWRTLDRCRDLLVRPLEVARCQPDAFRDAQGNDWPAFVLTFTSNHDQHQF